MFREPFGLEMAVSKTWRLLQSVFRASLKGLAVDTRQV